jgi:hypothetical protein
VKKLAILLLVVAAASCRRQVVVASVPPGDPNAPGAATPREAAQRFMSAAKAQDLQAMSMIWGTSAGPARATMGQQEIEQREVVMIGCLKHDTYRVVSEGPAASRERVLAVEIKFKDLTRSTNFYATPGPSNRWFVRTFDLESLRDICVRRA